MAAYIFASIEINDSAAYEEYRKRVPAAIAAYGGATWRAAAPSNGWKATRP